MATTTSQQTGFLERQLLIAMPGLEDPNFTRSVTLMCQHTEEGAVGITINRLSPMKLGDVMEQLGIPCSDESITDCPVLEGGPVHPDRGFVLHTPIEGLESSVIVADGVMVTTSRDILAAIASGNGPEHYLVALGYAGWGEGQLEDEILENAWISVPTDRAILFDHPLDNRWDTAVKALGVSPEQLLGVGGHA